MLWSILYQTESLLDSYKTDTLHHKAGISVGSLSLTECCVLKWSVPTYHTCILEVQVICSSEKFGNITDILFYWVSYSKYHGGCCYMLPETNMTLGRLDIDPELFGYKKTSYMHMQYRYSITVKVETDCYWDLTFWYQLWLTTENILLGLSDIISLSYHRT